MNGDLLDRYLDELIRALRSRGAFDPGLLEEVREHLVDAVEEGVRRGLTADAAAREALARFGPPDVVAAHAAAGATPFERRVLLALCMLSILAIVYLTLSLMILGPPRANYSAWFVEASLFIAQAALTIVALFRKGSLSSAHRYLLTAGGGAIALVGVVTLYASRTAHFEGYAVVLGTLLGLQGLVTVAHFLRPGTRTRTSS
jgi:hypothetical protein